MDFAPRYQTLLDVLESSVRLHGPRELFGTKKNGRWVWMTYAEFGRAVDRVRGGLASLGVGRGDRVAIVANNRVEWAVVAYACYGLGAVFVPMYEAQSASDWAFIIRDCEAKVLIVANHQAAEKAHGLFDGIASLRKLVVIDAETNGTTTAAGAHTTYAELLASGVVSPAVSLSADETAGIIYTSGTTATPKGVVLSHGNFASNVSAINEVFQFSPEDRSLAFLPWAHVFGQTAELHLLISFGSSMAICEGPDKILENLAEVRPTLIFSVPRIFNRIYMAVTQQLAERPKWVQRLVGVTLELTAKKRDGRTLRLHESLLCKLVDRLVFEKVRARFGGRLRFAVSGSAALSGEVASFVDSLGILVYEGYGLTETSPVVTVNFPSARKMGTVGRPLPGVRVRIDTAVGADSASGPSAPEGEILVYGPNVMKGYYRRPEESAASFTEDGGFRTGDMGCVDADGYLTITGRIKEQYKLENGKYVVPSPLEERLKLSPYVANVMVVGANKPHNVALVVANVPAIRRWAEAEHITLPSDVDALLAHERVRALFKSEIDRQGAAFKGFESIRDFALIATDFTTDNDMLTPKLSLKRRKVLEVYGPVIEKLYSKAPSNPTRRASPPSPES